MRLKFRSTLIFGLVGLGSFTAGHAQFQPGRELQAGDEFRITLEHTSEAQSERASSESRGGHEFVQRIVAIREDGIESEFDLPAEADEQVRSIEWHFPVRVFDPNDGEIQLLNRTEMETRRDAWLAAAEIPPETCGRWYFTWNAFQVDCEPESVLTTLESLRLQFKEPLEGAKIDHPLALTSGTLVLENAGSEDAVYSAELQVDPEIVRRDRARGDVITAEIMRESLSFEEAYAEQQTDTISGRIKLSISGDHEGNVWERRTVTEIETTKTDGSVENSILREVVQWRKVNAVRP